MKVVSLLLAMLMASPLSASASDWVDYENSGNRLTFSATYNGKPVQAALDSGVGPVVVSTPTGKASIERNMTIGIGGANVAVEEFRQAALGDIDILLGREFFDRHVLQIDYPNQRLRILDRKASNIKKAANIKMKRMSGSRYPVVRVNVNGDYKPWIVFDAGSTAALSFTKERVEKRGWLGKFESAESDSDPAFYVPSLQLGPFEHSNVVAIVSGVGVDNTRILADGRNTGSRLSGNKVKLPEGRLGFDILRQYVATIDYKRSLLQLAEPDDAARDAD